jgi:hypothetical protein
VIVVKERISVRKRLARAIEGASKPTPLLRLTFGDHSAKVALDPPVSAPLEKAFKSFGLDPKDPFHWRCLLDELATVLFGPARRRGGQLKWDEHRRRLFAVDVATARTTLTKVAARGRLPAPTGEDLVAYLHRKWPERYGRTDPETLRRYLPSGPPRTNRSKRVEK